MTSKLLEIEGTWEEILLQGDQFKGHRIKITILDQEDSITTPEASFRQAWQDIKEGKVRPISELWDGIDAE
ncbi:hypothetical protein [Geminocystis sp.]|uniref:hypothetical protein n=1 Tax=Geminocystis sp. TaxID=2664100 RepID=UPI003593B07F